MDFWSKKIWTIHLTRPSQNGKNYIDSHSNFFIGTQYIWRHTRWKIHMKNPLFENLYYFIVKDFQMVKMKVLDGTISLKSLWVFLLGLSNLKMTLTTLNIH